MTIKQQGGIFGRNPAFNDVDANSLDVDGSITATGLTVDGNIATTGGSTNNRGLLLSHQNNINASFISRSENGAADTGNRLLFDFDNDSFQVNTGGATRLDISNTGNVNVKTGNLVIGTSGNGIDFSATSGTGTSELFDDYEEGTWTPVFSDANSGGNTAGGSNIYASYTKVGRIVNVYLQGQSINTSGMTAGNSLFIQGLPYASSSTDSIGRSVGNARLSNVSFDDYVVPYLASEKTFFSLTSVSSGASAANVLVSDLTSGSADIRFHLTYQTD